MALTGYDFITPVRKEDGGEVASGPTQSDVHVDRIIGAIHPFIALDSDARMCAKCGLSKDRHTRSFSKKKGRRVKKARGGPSGWDTPVSSTPAAEPVPDEPDPELEASEEAANNSPATPPSPMLWRFMTPEDEANDPMVQAGNGIRSGSGDPRTPNTTPSAGFHEAIAMAIAKGRTRDVANQPNQPGAPGAPRGAESGDLGEWQSPRAFNFVPQGQVPSAQHLRPSAMDPPRDPMGNVKQDGPLFGPSNPGSPPVTQTWGSSDVEIPRNGTVFHHFKQCPQCGVATEPTNKTCPNPWCGHDLSNDQGSSYDHWEETGGVSKMSKSKKMVLGVDFHGTVTSFTVPLQKLCRAVMEDGGDVYIISGPAKRFPATPKTVKDQGYKKGRDFTKLWVVKGSTDVAVGKAKARLCKKLGVDVMIDNNPTYCKELAPVVCTLMIQDQFAGL